MKKITHILLASLCGVTFAIHSGESIASHSKVHCHNGVCHNYKSKHHKKHTHSHKHKTHHKKKYKYTH